MHSEGIIVTFKAASNFSMITLGSFVEKADANYGNFSRFISINFLLTRAAK